MWLKCHWKVDKQYVYMDTNEVQHCNCQSQDTEYHFNLVNLFFIIFQHLVAVLALVGRQMNLQAPFLQLWYLFFIIKGQLFCKCTPKKTQCGNVVKLNYNINTRHVSGHADICFLMHEISSTISTRNMFSISLSTWNMGTDLTLLIHMIHCICSGNEGWT